MANSEIPPVKERLEYPVPVTESGLTPGLLRVLHKQMGFQETVEKEHLKSKWRGVCLALHHLQEILHSDEKLTRDEDNKIPWKRFVVSAAASICPNSKPEDLLEVVCEAVSDLPEGNCSSLQPAEFVEVLNLIGEKCEIEQENTDKVATFLTELSQKDDHDGKLAPKHLDTEDCPKWQ